MDSDNTYAYSITYKPVSGIAYDRCKERKSENSRIYISSSEVCDIEDWTAFR
jgi:hypothetical protein